MSKIPAKLEDSLGIDSQSQPSKETNHFDLGLLASTTVRQSMSIFKPPNL